MNEVHLALNHIFEDNGLSPGTVVHNGTDQEEIKRKAQHVKGLELILSFVILLFNQHKCRRLLCNMYMRELIYMIIGICGHSMCMYMYDLQI